MSLHDSFLFLIVLSFLFIFSSSFFFNLFIHLFIYFFILFIKTRFLQDLNKIFLRILKEQNLITVLRKAYAQFMRTQVCRYGPLIIRWQNIPRKIRASLPFDPVNQKSVTGCIDLHARGALESNL